MSAQESGVCSPCLSFYCTNYTAALLETMAMSLYLTASEAQLCSQIPAAHAVSDQHTELSLTSVEVHLGIESREKAITELEPDSMHSPKVSFSHSNSSFCL